MTDKLLDLTKTVVAGYVANNPVPADGLPALIADVASALTKLSTPLEIEPAKPVPAVNPKRSVFPDYIICLENGKRFKSMKRHLMVHHNLTPEQYREKWGLPHDYPMIAPNYAEARSAVAKSIGLGRRAKEAAAPAAKTKAMGAKAAKATSAKASAPVKTPRKAAGAAPAKVAKARKKRGAPSNA
jgi:predicted transcriptional regulator